MWNIASLKAITGEDTWTVCMVVNVVGMWGWSTRWTCRIKKEKQTKKKGQIHRSKYSWLQNSFSCVSEVFPLRMTRSIKWKWHDVKHCAFRAKLQQSLNFILFFLCAFRHKDDENRPIHCWRMIEMSWLKKLIVFKSINFIWNYRRTHKKTHNRTNYKIGLIRTF